MTTACVKSSPHRTVRETGRVSRAASGAAAGLLALCCGCLNPESFNAVLGYYPTYPGDTPFLMVRVINETSGTLTRVPIIYTDGSSSPTIFYVTDLNYLAADSGILLQWPIYQLALGESLNDPYTPSITISFQQNTNTTDSNGTGASPSSTTSSLNRIPFGHPTLVAGTDFNRGDTLIFRLVQDVQTAPYVRVWINRIAASETQAGRYREDPFLTLWGLLATKGFLDVTPVSTGGT